MALNGRVEAEPPMGSGASPAGCSVPAAAALRVSCLTSAALGDVWATALMQTADAKARVRCEIFMV